VIGLAEVLSPAVANVIKFEVFLASRRLRRHGFEVDDVEQELVLHWLRHPAERGSEGVVSFQRRMGKALARKCGTRFGEHGLRIERGRPDRHTKVQCWRVAGDVDAVLSTGGVEPAGLRNRD
jgi:hypothetical protein